MSRALDAVALQVFVGALRAACDEMGAVLVRSAHSANIKERRDCSTALFDAGGELVVQAEHIPVHLGSMPDSVGAVLEEDQEPGGLWILNDPYRGGTHLPDITLISPVFEDGGDLLGFAASRAHHADVGGPTPAGMPAGSTELGDEGVVIPPTRVGDGVLEELAGRMRNPQQRLADLRAQRAANLVGARRLGELAERHGGALARTAMREILDYAERRTRDALAELGDGEWEAHDVLEAPGEPQRDVSLRVRARLEGDSLVLDFEGTDDQIKGNLNCPLAVTKSAAFFAVRVLTDPDGPPSAGAFRPIEVRAPEGSLLNARPPAAVAGWERRDLQPCRRPGHGRAGRRGPGAGPGTGDDEQPDPGRRGLDVLRDDRRRPGRLPWRRRAQRRPRGDVEHPQHPGRGARGRVPASRARAGAAGAEAAAPGAIAAATGSSASSRRFSRCRGA